MKTSIMDLVYAGHRELTAGQIAEHIIKYKTNPWLAEWDFHSLKSRIHHRLRYLRDQIEEETDWLVHTVNEYYFIDLKYNKVDYDYGDYYVPRGSRRRAGLRFTDKPDLLWQASLGTAESYDKNRMTKHGNKLVRAIRLGLPYEDAQKHLVRLLSSAVDIGGNGHVNEALARVTAIRAKVQNL